MGRRLIQTCGCGGHYVLLPKARGATRLERYSFRRMLVMARGRLREREVYELHVCKPMSERKVSRFDVANRLRVLANQIYNEDT